MHKALQYPILCVSFQPSSAVGEAGQSPEPSEFVSAVTWRNASNVLLAANSQGHIKVSHAIDVYTNLSFVPRLSSTIIDDL